MSENSSLESVCIVCGTKATQKCTGCYSVTYCGKQHQVEDWKKGHKNSCKCYEIQLSDQLGRYCVATRNIKKGQIILKEKPTLIGPKTVTPAICLSCHKYLSPPPGQDNFNFCSQCNWPMCNFVCENEPIHQTECKIFAEKKFIPNINFTSQGKTESNYCSIMALRLLLMKEKQPEIYDKIMTLESHLDQRRNTQLYQILGMNIPVCLRGLLGNNKINRELALTISGIFDTNCFDVKIPSGKINARGIYYKAAMFSHDCHPNARHLFRENTELILFATTDIKKGDIISLSYTQPLKGTLERRTHLKDAKCFECMCQRCTDPTEFGLYMSSIVCPKCNENAKLIPIDVTDIESDFKCESCDAVFDLNDVKETKKIVLDAIKLANKTSPNDFETILETYKDIQPPNASIFLEIKYALLQLYGNPNDLSEEHLQRKIDICMELLEISKKLDPDYGALRTTLLKELHGCLTVLFNLKSQDETNKYKELYEEAIRIKQFEENLLK
uniref:CSON001018 protein n=1 Tax=Culicoides sonorensis TaxID=179676 RepID=A0A336KXB9_CULSO